MPKKAAGCIIDAVFVKVIDALVKEGTVTIIGFGSFKGTSKEITIPAHKAVSFSPGKGMKEIVNKKKKLPTTKCKATAKCSAGTKKK